jgi:hypothetical protein
MAEYNMNYEEIRQFLDTTIKKLDKPETIKKYQAEILAAITARDEDDNVYLTAINESVELWENQIGTPSELLLGTRYIVIKDSVLYFIEMAAASGLLAFILNNLSKPEKIMTVNDISTATNVAVGLIRLFQSVAELEDFDFCIYMQAVTHFKEHKPFTIDELKDWFPHGEKCDCNMHNSKWNCTHILDDDSCNMLQVDNLSIALDSLCNNKKILKRVCKERHFEYSFKW